MSSPEQDRPLQCAEDTKGKGWQETVPEVLTLTVTQFASTHHMNSVLLWVMIIIVCHCESTVNID